MRGGYRDPHDSLLSDLGFTAGTLRVWRSQGKGPNYYKVGSTVRYEMDDLEAWKNENVKHVELTN